MQWILLLKEVLLKVQNNVYVGGPPVYSKSHFCILGAKLIITVGAKIGRWGYEEHFLFGHCYTAQKSSYGN